MEVKERVPCSGDIQRPALPGAEITVIQQTGYISVNDYTQFLRKDRQGDSAQYDAAEHTG